MNSTAKTVPAFSRYRNTRACLMAAGAILFLGLVTTAPAFAATCVVVDVADGETLIVRCGTAAETKVRLADIGLPGVRQPLGQEARQHLEALVFAREVEVEAVGMDTQQRVLAQVYMGYMHVNATLVAEGMAQCHREQQRASWCRRAEATARIEQRGMWTSAPMAPMPVHSQVRPTAGRKTAS